MNARRSARYQVHIPVTIGRKKAFLHQRAGHGVIADLNSFGCRISEATPVEARETLSLNFSLTEQGRLLHIPNAVVRWVEGNELGCEFVGLGPALRHLLMKSAPEGNARGYPRMSVTFPIKYTIDGKEGLGLIYNISFGGCAVEGNLAPDRVGQEVHAQFDLAQNQQKIMVERATASWIEGKKFGLQFSKVRPTEQESLSLFVREQNS